MTYYAGIDVSLESASVCVIDAAGRIIREGKVASEPEALTGWLKESGMSLEGVGLEAGPLSQWLHSGLRQAGVSARPVGARDRRRGVAGKAGKHGREGRGGGGGPRGRCVVLASGVL